MLQALKKGRPVEPDRVLSRRRSIRRLQSANFFRNRILSRRRSIRRLRRANFFRILVFTRNPFLSVLMFLLLLHQTPQKAKGFRVFYLSVPSNQWTDSL